MEASLQAHAVRQLKRILICLSRFGDELNINATHDSLQLSTVNQSRSAFCLFTLSATEFFHRYYLSPALHPPANPTSTSSTNRSIKCKLPVRAVLAVLSNTSTAPGNLDRLEMRIVDPGDGLRGKSGRRRGRDAEREERERERETGEGIEARLILKLVCKHGILKTHSLHLGPSKFLVAIVDPDTTLSSFTLSSKTLREWSEHFFFSLSSSNSSSGGSKNKNPTNAAGEDVAPVKAESELGWMFDSTEVRVKTFDVSIGTGGGNGRSIMATEVKCGLDDFEEYYVKDPPVVLAFPMKEFRAAFSLADQFSIPLVTSFSEAGQPISISLKVQGIEAEFAIATIARDLFASEIAAKKAAREREVKPKLGDVAGNAARAESEIQGTRKRDSQMAGLDVERDANGRPNAEAGPSGSRHGSMRPPHGKKKPTLEFSQHEERPASMHGHGNAQMIPDTARNGEEQQEPLFLPSASQDMREFSQREEVMQAGLGLENMDDDEIAGMMDMDEEDEAELQDSGGAHQPQEIEAAAEREQERADDEVEVIPLPAPEEESLDTRQRVQAVQEHRHQAMLQSPEPGLQDEQYDEEDENEITGSQFPPTAGAQTGRQWRAIFDE